jgi:hypothetical protein
MHRQWNQQQGGGGGGGDGVQQQYQQQPRYQQHRAPPHGGGTGGPPAGRVGANKGGSSNKCGLFGFNSFNQRRVSIPLKSVAIRAHVVDFFARVEVTQQYENTEHNPIEVRHAPPPAPTPRLRDRSIEWPACAVIERVADLDISGAVQLYVPHRCEICGLRL